MHVVIFEPARGGHHLGFLRYAVEDFLAGGHTVTLAVEHGPVPSDELRAALGSSLEACRWHRLDRGPGRFLHGTKLNALVRAQRAVGADLVFVNCLDVFTSALFRRRALGLPAPRILRGKVAGIFVRPRVADAAIAKSFGELWKQRGFLRLLRDGWFKRLLVLDETLPTRLAAGVDPSLVGVLPDPWEGAFTTDRDDARRTLGLPADVFLYLHYGTASPRKGLPTVLRATASLPAGTTAALVCAGRAGEAHANELAALARRGRAHVFNRHIADAEEPLFFRACDAVVLAYEGHYGSSAIQARAAAAGRMVISSDEGLVGHRTQTHGLGLTFATRNAKALAQALAQAATLPADTFAPGLAAYARHHSRDTFRRTLLNAATD
jgi:glycosyltransferase involved in cell wall biosynthesis